MSIVTKKGDSGTTSLVYGQQISKASPVIEPYAKLDSLNCSLGLARAYSKQYTSEWILKAQRHLIQIMGELVTVPEDSTRYASQFGTLTSSAIEELDLIIFQLEEFLPPLKTWIIPGDSPSEAFLQKARTDARDAERSIVNAKEHGRNVSPIILQFMNRISDCLFLSARFELVTIQNTPENFPRT